MLRRAGQEGADLFDTNSLMSAAMRGRCTAEAIDRVAYDLRAHPGLSGLEQFAGGRVHGA
jgi:hypothetical protein